MKKSSHMLAAVFLAASPLISLAEDGRVLEELVGSYPTPEGVAPMYARSQIVKSNWISLPDLNAIWRSDRIETDPNGPDRISFTHLRSAIQFNFFPIESAKTDSELFIEELEFVGLSYKLLQFDPGPVIINASAAVEIPSLAVIHLISALTSSSSQFAELSGPNTVGVLGVPEPEWFHYPIASPFWRDRLEVETGMREGWMGRVNDALYPQVDHAQHGRGRVEYTRADGVTQLWWHDAELGWWFTTETLYPWIWSNERQSWLYYAVGSSAPRWFYAAGTASWLSVP